MPRKQRALPLVDEQHLVGRAVAVQLALRLGRPAPPHRHVAVDQKRHALRFGVYTGLAGALVSSRRWPRVLAAAGAIAYARTPVQRGWARTRDTRERALATVAVPALIAFTDAAKMAGYAAGLVDRTRSRPPVA